MTHKQPDWQELRNNVLVISSTLEAVGKIIYTSGDWEKRSYKNNGSKKMVPWLTWNKKYQA